MPGLGPDPRIAQREDEAKAIGGACRYAVRGIEDCYANNPKTSKGAIFEVWKDMDGYMRDNKIEGIPATLALELKAKPKKRQHLWPPQALRPRNSSGRVSRALEHRHALHMRRVWKHIHCAHCGAAVARKMHKNLGIARQRGRIAAHIDDPSRRRPDA